MIQSFLDSWVLFQNTYIVGWLIGVLLAVIGVVAVARDQIFIGAAVSEASTLGMAVMMWFGLTLGASAPEWLSTPWALSGAAVVFSVLAAVVTERAREGGGESHEAMLGWVFLLGAAGSILLVSHNPHGLEEIQRVLASSIIGATEEDVAVFGVLLVIVALAVWLCRRSLLLYALDPDTAEAIGVPVRLTKFLVALALGLSAGLAIRVSGLLYTFGCLVLPALVAKNVCREVRSMFLVAPVVALVTAVLAFVVANEEDYPPAQMAVVLLALALVAAWVFRRVRQGLSHA